jgi:hypothetical protein
MSYIWEERMDLKGAELQCAISIADHADSDGVCFPGLKAIAKKMRCTVRHVEGLIRRLESKKVFIIEQGIGRGNMTTFRFIKGEQSFTVSEPEKVNNPSSISQRKRRTIVHKKDEQSCKEKVNNCASPLNKEEPFKESIKETTAEPKEKSSIPAEKFSALIKHHCDRVGRVSDGKAQGGAIKTLLKTFSVEDCIACYDCLVLELKPIGWRSRVSWLNVNAEIDEWVKAGKPEKWIKENGTNRQANSQRHPEQVKRQSETFFNKKFGIA